MHFNLICLYRPERRKYLTDRKNIIDCFKNFSRQIDIKPGYSREPHDPNTQNNDYRSTITKRHRTRCRSEWKVLIYQALKENKIHRRNQNTRKETRQPIKYSQKHTCEKAMRKNFSSNLVRCSLVTATLRSSFSRISCLSRPTPTSSLPRKDSKSLMNSRRLSGSENFNTMSYSRSNLTTTWRRWPSGDTSKPTWNIKVM